MSEAIPVICLLTDQELQARRRNHLDQLRGFLLGASETENGFIYKFPLKSSILQDLAEIIDLERRCCPFLNFRLAVDAGADFVTLEMTGAENAKESIRALFGWN